MCISRSGPFLANPRHARQTAQVGQTRDIGFLLRAREGEQRDETRSGGNERGRYVSCERQELESLGAWMMFGDLQWPHVRAGW
jgi:hypothetical protein